MRAGPFDWSDCCLFKAAVLALLATTSAGGSLEGNFARVPPSLCVSWNICHASFHLVIYVVS